jgi:ABC-type Fe3+/spermidine/putrescine transport system ATPase subunit
VKSRERMRAELRRLQRELRIPFIHATQESSEALALSDRIAVLDAGRLQQLGTPQEIYSQPANRTVAHLMGFANVLSGHVREIRAGIARMDAGPDFRLEIPAREGIAIGDHLEVIVRPENIRLSRLEPPVVNGAPARISDATFLGNITEYYATLPSGRGIRVQAHPIQRFAVGDNVSVEIDVGRCGLLRLQAGRSPTAP